MFIRQQYPLSYLKQCSIPLIKVCASLILLSLYKGSSLIFGPCQIVSWSNKRRSALISNNSQYFPPFMFALRRFWPAFVLLPFSFYQRLIISFSSFLSSCLAQMASFNSLIRFYTTSSFLCSFLLLIFCLMSLILFCSFTILTFILGNDSYNKIFNKGRLSFCYTVGADLGLSQRVIISLVRRLVADQVIGRSFRFIIVFTAFPLPLAILSTLC